MVEKLFWVDPYLDEISALITAVDGNEVKLDKTIIYTFSGGQSSDSGTIGGFNIISSRKEELEIIYELDNHNLSVGDKVDVKIDFEKRYKIMKLHFACELVLVIISNNYNLVKVGANITETKGRIDFECDYNISSILDDVKEKLDVIINSNLPIKSEFEDVSKQIRYWEIDSYAKVLCGGTHPKFTGEIGNVKLKRCNIGSGKERVEITLV